MKLNLGQNTTNTPKTEHARELPKLTLKPIFGSLIATICSGLFFTFVVISLMVLYQFESLHLDDYNLIYSQNKNKGFDKFFTAFPLKTQHFPFTNIPQNQSKPTPINNTLQNSTQHNPKTDLQLIKITFTNISCLHGEEREVRV